MNIKLITTTYHENIKKTRESSNDFSADCGVEMNVVNIYPEMEYQTFEGFGGALTEAASYTYSLMGENNQKRILDAYFGSEGNRYNLVRTHIDSCDFSVNQYAAINDPSDAGLTSFSLERDEQYIIPFLEKAQQTANKELSVMLSPWSPPAFMKTNGQRAGGGSLKPEYRQFWADYICHYIKQYREKGFSIDMITIQNEPNATQTWDSCLYTSKQEKEFLRDYLYPSLEANRLGDIEVCIWDHNKERMFERACEIIDEDTNKMVKGVAFHWYTGEHFDAIKLVREKFPDKKLIFTEGCVEYSRFSEAGQLENAQMYAYDIIGNINAGMNAFIDWNIILNKEGGPNHVNNFCDAPIMCDTDNDIIQENLSYTYIGHFSRYIEPGAKRIASTKYTDKLDVVSMKNPNGSIVIVLLNRSQEAVPVALRIAGQVTEFSVPAASIVTGVI
ncbi:glycoside hydrolase family 30 protein [Falsibacillus albus]|uniref:Glucosylceramidase n=1 Tax=Falsibacillus albus TaxID=2478915 RepID=A0A3L7JUQ7_9BACI|nr:glycoside hydrolase family 30 beta sandwich domain-containing protein [Falsibacillus albus]RLQ94025.1 glucosylceramidase [Falsibacillus albus]